MAIFDLPAIKLLLSSFDLLLLIVAIFLEVLLALLIYFGNRKSATNIIFALLSLSTILWLLVSFVVRIPEYVEYSLTLHRLAIFFAAPMSAFFFLLTHTFPHEKIQLSRSMFWLVIISTVTMMGFNISPYAFIADGLSNNALTINPGPGLIPFSIISTVFSFLAVYYLIKKMRTEKGETLSQVKMMLIGMVAMLALIIGTILIPIMVFNSGIFIPFTPLYTLIFLGITGYAIVKFHLYNAKVMATEALVAILLVILFAKIFTEQSIGLQIFDFIIFLFIIFFGILLIRSVRREVEQREQLAKLSKQLQKANVELKKLDRAKSEFISIASHQLRTPMTVIKGFISMSLEGSFGKVPKKLQDPLERAYESNMRLLGLVEDLLNISRIESGKLKYKFVKVHLSDMVSSVVEQLMESAKKKGLKLIWEKPKKSLPKVTIDELKIRQIVINLIDNAIKYTPKGSVTISVTKENENIVFRSKDTGLGMNEDERSGLFEKFRRSKRSTLENTGGSGLGLFVGRMMVTVHGGKIWAESEGHDKGSTFAFSIPINAGSLPKELHNGDDV